MDRETILQLPGEIVKVETRRNQALRIQFDSQEAILPDVRARIMSCVDLVGWLSFLPTTERTIDALDVVGLPDIPKREEEEKSPSARYRAVLWRYWDIGKPTATFEQFYRQHMEKLIEGVKEKLPKV